MTFIHEIKLDDAVSRPADHAIARRGPRRLVKLVPVPGNYAVPAIWTSPDPIMENFGDGPEPAIQCIVLMAKEPKPQTMLITVPKKFLDSCQEVPVEW